MCGRYYVDDDTAREIERLVRQVDEKMRGTAAVVPQINSHSISHFKSGPKWRLGMSAAF